MTEFSAAIWRSVLSGIGACILLLVSAAHANTSIYDVSGDVTTTIAVIEEPRTAADFYDQGGQQFSANVPFDLQPNTLHVFLYRDANTGDFSLGFVTNAFREGGSRGSLAGTITGLGSGAFIEVADDNAGELAMTFAGSGTAVMNFNWDGRLLMAASSPVLTRIISISVLM